VVTSPDVSTHLRAGQLGMVSSSRRFKDEIKPIDNSSGPILRLRQSHDFPVEHYCDDVSPCGGGTKANDGEGVGRTVMRFKTRGAYGGN
jgi:hypothetical protein